MTTPRPDAPAEDDLLLEHQLCFALTVAARSVVGAYKPVLEKLNLTHPQYLVMLCLWEASPRTVRNISEALAQEPATISPLLRRLEAAGFITRRRADGNERALAVELTPEGRRPPAGGAQGPGHHDGQAGPDPRRRSPNCTRHDGRSSPPLRPESAGAHAPRAAE